jgi:hypothetical protein
MEIEMARSTTACPRKAMDPPRRHFRHKCLVFYYLFYLLYCSIFYSLSYYVFCFGRPSRSVSVFLVAGCLDRDGTIRFHVVYFERNEIVIIIQFVSYGTHERSIFQGQA